MKRRTFLKNSVVGVSWARRNDLCGLGNRGANRMSETKTEQGGRSGR